MDWITDPNAWIGLLTLTVLEIVLGIDNIIFISILAGKLPRGSASAQRAARPARRVLLAPAAAAAHRVGREADDAAVHRFRHGRVSGAS